MSHDVRSDNDLAADLLWGVRGKNGIAKFLKKKPSEVYYLIAKGLPVKRHGHRIITSTRSELRRYFSSDTT